MALTTRTIRSGDVDLVVEDAGRGGRPLLLVHGFTGAREDFTEWFPALAERGFHVASFDHRGHGQSAKPEDEAAYSLDLFAADTLAVLDALGWERCDIVGHSMGGMITQLLVLGHPQRFDRVVLMGTHHGAVDIDPGLVAFGLDLVRTEGVEGLLRTLKQIDDPLSTPAYRRLLEDRPGYEEFCDRKLLAASPAMYAAMLQHLPTAPDRLHQLAALPHRTLVLVGALDAAFLAASERMAATIPGARLVVLPDAGHSTQFEAGEAWFDVLTTFLEEDR